MCVEAFQINFPSCFSLFLNAFSVLFEYDRHLKYIAVLLASERFLKSAVWWWVFIYSSATTARQKLYRRWSFHFNEEMFSPINHDDIIKCRRKYEGSLEINNLLIHYEAALTLFFFSTNQFIIINLKHLLSVPNGFTLSPAESAFCFCAKSSDDYVEKFIN